MKWVKLGMWQAAVFVAIAAWIDRSHRGAILAGARRRRG